MKKKWIFILPLFLLLLLGLGIAFFFFPKEEVKIELKDMSYTTISTNTNEVNVYLFYGDGCPHCEEMVTYLNTLPNSLKTKIHFYTFEVWYNGDSFQLLMDFGKKLGTTPANIPFLVIGDTYFEGFTSKEEKDIVKSLKEYSKEKDRRDILRELKTE